jgi:lipoprotein-anchoring transpeptidase ErfK/SrfK
MLLTAMLTAGPLSACDGSPDQPEPGDAARPVPLRLEVSPADRNRNTPVSIEIGIKVGGGRIEAVRLTQKGRSTPLAGALRDDGTAWVPDQPLEYGRAYRAEVTATSPDGAHSRTQVSTFTTMTEPDRHTGTGLYLRPDKTYGVAMPVVVEFDPPVPPSARATVQRRLFVRSSPPQPGAWRWEGGGQAFYRPPSYWLPGTVLAVRIALKGQPMGGGYYGDTDRVATVRIGRKLLLAVNNRGKRMNVYIGGKLVRRIPVSLGKPSTPSSSGHLVIMSKEQATVFDTRREGPDGYRINIRYAQRLTWGGEFIHAAPWSEGDQGYRNVSHGCVNVSYADARWLFDRTRIGDPVIVRGTEVKVTPGNGWTAWDLPWTQYVRGSALPVPAPTTPAKGN